MPTAAHPPQQGQDEEQDENDQPDHDAKWNAVVLVLLLRLGGDLRCLVCGQGQLLDDGIGTGLDPAGHVAGLEARDDLLVDDQAGQTVGQDRFQAIANLDPDLALLGRDDQHRAFVLVFGAQLPVPAKLIAIVGNLVA